MTTPEPWRAAYEAWRATYTNLDSSNLIEYAFSKGYLAREAEGGAEQKPRASLGWSSAMHLAAAKAREWAAHYSEASDGCNTFILFAEWAEKQAAAIPPTQAEGGTVLDREAVVAIIKDHITVSREDFEEEIPKDQREPAGPTIQRVRVNVINGIEEAADVILALAAQQPQQRTSESTDTAPDNSAGEVAAEDSLPTYEPKLIYQPDLDILSYTPEDKPLVSRRIDTHFDLLLDHDTREPIGFQVWGASRIGWPTSTPDIAELVREARECVERDYSHTEIGSIVRDLADALETLSGRMGDGA